MLKQGLILQIKDLPDHCQKEKIKGDWINTDEIGGKIMIEFV